MATSRSLPYNPTTILLPPPSAQRRDLAYAFLTTAETQRLVSLNFSSTLSPSTLALDDISPNLPFLSNTSNALIPSIAPSGEISVYTGSCATPISSELWRFTPDNSSSVGNGTWEQQVASTGKEVAAAALSGADFLASAFSFSTLARANVSQTKIYVFGGMCSRNSSTTSTWQSAASYSNRMLRLNPAASSSEETNYTLGLTSSRGAPIAEAGFTITGLTPTYSNGSGLETQQQNFVLVGGHTQTAFINMSQVAIWSLPEENWSFVTVESPATTKGNTELAVKSTPTSVDSRSGHTAVLTEDGSKIVVFGGWVGDVSQAADPQLVVLSLGQGFGGSGDWQWTVPDEQPAGDGIYGHGAVVLPGNVMMVLGGLNISSSGNSKRQASSGAQAQFFNATSMTWASSYTNPSYLAAMASGPADDSDSSGSSSTSLKVGLGAGLGLGLAAILGAILVYFWYNRRHARKIKEAREKDLRDLSLGAANVYESPSRENSQSGGFLWTNGRWSGRSDDRGSQDPSYGSNGAALGYETLQSGAPSLGDRGQILPPKKIPRKPLHSRNTRGIYQPTPNFDFTSGTGHGRANSLGTAGPIHPIYEADEDDTSHHGLDGVGIAIGDPNYTPSQAEENSYSDPFKNPPLANFSVPIRRNRSVSNSEAESSAQSREREVQEWVSDWAAADALLNSQARTHSSVGRISPTRRAQLVQATTIGSVSGEEDCRTASNLSERTERSVNMSTMSISRSGSSSQGRSRANSLRGFITGINPFTSTIVTTTVASLSPSPIFDSSTGLPIPHSAGSGSSRSFATARTSFPALQAEGEALLPRPVEDFSISAGDHTPARSQADREFTQGSPSKNKPSALGKSWLGSLRRVFSPVDAADTHVPIYRDVSPTRNQPRRTVSASAALWRRKQGKSDWEDSAPRSNTFTDSDYNYHFNASEKPLSQRDTDDEDWDVERAVENRVVQVMFTVPRERLRVVNCGEGDLDEAGSSVGGSVRSRKSVGSGLRRRGNSTLGAGVREAEAEAEEQEEGSIGEDEEEALLLERDDDRAREVPTYDENDTAKGNGKGKEKENITQPDPGSECAGTTEARESALSPSPPRSRVLEIVERIERNNSPER
ncbi:hypothetical protein PZA11_006991 [Diplocarpon coronariae]